MVAKVLHEVYQNRYGLDIKKDVVYVSSDTAIAARKVSSELELTQDGCTMHVIQLIIGYLIGAKENTKTEMVIDLSHTGGLKKVTQIITPGGDSQKANVL